MTAEIIAVGSELLTPERIDTNSLFLTQKLQERGIEVIRKSIVGDDRGRLADEIRHACRSSNIVITTGGLGPTLDDITREAASDAVGRKLVFRQEIIDWIEERFRRRGRKMADINRRQGYILEGAEILPNKNGTAPGQWLKSGPGVLVLLPGPPRELNPLFEEQCVPRLSCIETPFQYYTVSLRVANMPESEVDQRIAPIYSAEPQVATTILAGPGDIQIHLRAKAPTAEEARSIAEELAQKVEAELGGKVYTRRNESLEEVVGRTLRERGMTLAVAESCTGGLLAERITAVPGSSDYFVGGFVSYSEDAKIAWLGVGANTIRNHGVVSPETAAEMAQTAREKAKASIAASVTGVAGPAGGTDEIPVGTVYIGVASESGVQAHKRYFPGERDLVRRLAAQNALELILRAVSP